MRKIAVFDFDGTLTSRDTLLMFILDAKGLVAFTTGFLYRLPLIIMMKLRLYPNYRAKEKVFSYFFKGMPLDTFNLLCHRFAETHRHLLRPQAVETLEQAKAEGTEVLIISASIDNWVQPFFPDVKVLGTQIEVEDGILTGRFLTKNCYGQEKVNRLSAVYPDRETYHLTAYGDSRGDKELLAYADESHYKPFRL